MQNGTQPAELKRALLASSTPAAIDNDYQIVMSIGRAFLGRSASGATSMLIPLDEKPTAIGRQGGGFVLIVAHQVAFDHGGKRWTQAAAVVECTAPELVDVFLVLIADLADRLICAQGESAWRIVLAWVDEWQTLLTRSAALTSEQQLGLWGELWLISKDNDPDRMIAAWRGPERESVDFFLDGIAVDVKTSRDPHVHHISQRQIDSPVGIHRAYLLSIWVGIEPSCGMSLKELAEIVLERASDPAALLKQFALAGYVPRDSSAYATKFVALETPWWFRVEDVPRIRESDAGVSQIRYVVRLDPDMAIAAEAETELWRHFCRTEAFLVLGKS